MNATLDLAGFYALLAKTPRDWDEGQEGELRRHLSSKRGQCLQCPVSAIRNRAVAYAWAVGSALGLSTGNLADITAAADNHDGHDPHIRTELLRACGLEQEKARA